MPDAPFNRSKAAHKPLPQCKALLPVNSMTLPRSGRYEIAIVSDGQDVATQFIDAEVANGEETEEAE